MRELKGWHVLVIVLAFFGVTIGVNFVFVSYALSTFSGEDETQPYLKGLAYNQTLDARAAQAALGWRAEIGAQRLAGGETLVGVRVTSRNGEALSALDMSARLRHPVNSRLDREVKLLARGDGRYDARIDGLPRGQWDIVAVAKTDHGAGFSAMRRVMLP